MTGEEALRIALLSGGISFAAAVVAVVVGQLLGQWLQRQTDKMRWEREERARRRIRAEEAAGGILDSVHGVADMCRRAAFSADLQQRGYAPGKGYPSQEDLLAAHDQIRRAAVLVPEEPVRIASIHAADTFYYYAPEQMNLDSWQLAWILETEIETVIGAYLRGEESPPTPGIDKAWAEVEEHESWIAEMLEKDERDRAAAQDQPSVGSGPAS